MAAMIGNKVFFLFLNNDILCGLWMKELLHSHMLVMQPRMGLSGSSVCLWSLQGAAALPLLLVQIFLDSQVAELF